MAFSFLAEVILNAVTTLENEYKDITWSNIYVQLHFLTKFSFNYKAH